MNQIKEEWSESFEILQKRTKTRYFLPSDGAHLPNVFLFDHSTCGCDKKTLEIIWFKTWI